MSRYLKLTYAILVGLIIFSLFRIGILIAYYDQFKDNSFWMIFLSLLHGIRFDASIFLTIISPFIVLLLLPVNNKIYERIIYWALFLIYVVLTIYLMIDAVYFGYVNRHLANELTMLKNDTGFILSVTKSYFYVLLLIFIAAAIAGYFWNKFVKISIKPTVYNKKSLIKSFAMFILIAGVIFVFIRGSVGLKPISTINAFVIGNHNLGNLSLNGLFTSLRYMTEKHTFSKDMYSFYDDNKTHLLISSLKNDNCSLPFQLQERPNIVFLLLESWSAYYVDSFSNNPNGVKQSITPNLDRLASEGIKFMYHYSPERRSISAIQAMLLGIPPMDGMPRIGFGLEVIGGSGNIGHILTKEGYDSVFVKASKRNSHYMDVIAKSVGFQKYFGQEDIKQLIDYPDYSAAKFGWDYEAYMKLADELKKMDKNKPFFAFLFTGVTHVPYAEPNSINVKFPHDVNNENGFKNTLVYADWSLGEFFKKIENEEYFKNTIFIITADHILGRFEKIDFPETYRVPLVIWSPMIKEHKEFKYPTSHVDIPPTVLSLLNIKYDKDSYIGENIFCKNDNSYSVIHSYGSAAIVTKDKWLNHSFQNILEKKPDNMSKDIENMLTKLLLSYYQESYNIMVGNKK